ncbi:MAG: LamG domain-containing protein [Candidatus Hydrogenedentota bacterium]
MFEQRMSLCAKGLVALAVICAAGMAQAEPPGYWLQFSGGSHITIDTGEISLPTTIELWVHPMSNDIISPVGGHPDHAELHFYRHGDGYFYLFQTGPDDDREILEGSAVPTDEWHHLALVVTTDGRSLYVNGDLQAEDDFEVNPHRFVSIGAREDGQYPWNGGINEVRVWDTARSQTEIQENMDRLLSGDEDGLIHYWPMNEGSGDSIEDIIGDVTGSFVDNPEWQGESAFVDSSPALNPLVAPGDSADLGPVLIHEDFEEEATYQWYFEGEELEDETGNGVFIDEATVDQAGNYSVVVSHPDFAYPIAEYDMSLRVQEAQSPAAGALGLGALAGALALLGGIRRMRR